MRPVFAGLLIATALPLQAAAETCGVDVHARFIESAPRDSFVFENKSSVPADITNLSLDLRPSAGRLIFDTESGGAGVEVFQLYRGESSDAELAALPSVRDGDDTLALAFKSFGAGQTYRFSIDVDDQLTNSDLGQIRVSGGEMQGATLSVVTADGSTYRAIFDASNRARLSAPCS